MRGGKVNKRSLAGEFSLSLSPCFSPESSSSTFFFSDGETSALIIVKASQPPLVTTLNGSHQHFQLNAPFKNIFPREIAAHISTYRYRSFFPSFRGDSGEARVMYAVRNKAIRVSFTRKASLGVEVYRCRGVEV